MLTSDSVACHHLQMRLGPLPAALCPALSPTSFPPAKPSYCLNIRTAVKVLCNAAQPCLTFRCLNHFKLLLIEYDTDQTLSLLLLRQDTPLVRILLFSKEMYLLGVWARRPTTPLSEQARTALSHRSNGLTADILQLYNHCCNTILVVL